LVIAASRGSNAAMSCSPRLYKRRHTPKWFMVRHSYIICVEELEGLNIYDVFLVDSDFKIEWHALPGLTKTIEDSDKHSQHQHHFFTISNAERAFKLGSRSDKQMLQFIQSIQMMTAATPWSKKHRFDSFAPIRQNVQCQWLVDGVRTYCICLIVARLFLECK
jgi:phospholipase D1/2